MDSPGFAAFFSEEGTFTMANGQLYKGRAEIENFVRGFFSALEGIGHEVTGVWETPSATFSEGVVSYSLHGGRTVTHPYLGVLEFDGELIRAYRAYLDPAPLVAALQPSAQ